MHRAVLKIRALNKTGATDAIHIIDTIIALIPRVKLQHAITPGIACRGITQLIASGAINLNHAFHIALLLGGLFCRGHSTGNQYGK